MTDNKFFLCLDSVRYDTFKSSTAPNMKAVGYLQRLYEGIFIASPQPLRENTCMRLSAHQEAT